MTPEKILRECEKLTHNGRMKRMVEFGREAAGNAKVRDAIRALAQGDVYQQSLAVQTCAGSRDTASVVQALFSPSYRVRAIALGLAPQMCSNDELLRALDETTSGTKKALLYKMRYRRRFIPIDNYIAKLAARQDTMLQRSLFFGSLEVVKQHLPDVVEQMDLVSWKNLARAYPELAVEQLQARAAIQAQDQRLLIQVKEVLPLLINSRVDLALSLVTAVVKVIPLAKLNVQELAQRRPIEIADLILQAGEQVDVQFEATAQKRLDTDRLLALHAYSASTIDLDYFHALSPQNRLALYNAYGIGWRDEDGIISNSIVALLPATQRLEEGRRHLALPALATRPTGRLDYVKFLPWDEAQQTLQDALRSSDADIRGAALHTLISSVCYQRERLAEALQLIVQRRNEQDPVRCQMLLALADLPRKIWRAEHLDTLAEIIQAALDATDLSETSGSTIEQLVFSILPSHPEWCATQLPLIYRKRGYASFFEIDEYITDADVKHIASDLLPVLQAWSKQEREVRLMQLAQAFGNRLRVFDELLDILIVTVERTRSAPTARSILYLMTEHRPDRLATFIPQLLKQDKSCIDLEPVYNYLHRRRQDLITPFLGQRAYKGRFSTGETRFVLPLENGFFRWLPAQQETFARTLIEVAQDDERDIYQFQEVIKRLAYMPVISPLHLINLASDERQPVRETALRALGRMDAGQGIPTLLDALNDDRARIAIYALRHALLNMPQAEALTILRTVPLAKVTVAKEAVRLLGELTIEDAYQELLAWDRQELHRDVRIALLRALWMHLERSETWEVLTRALQADDPALAQGLIPIPADGISSQASKQLVALMAGLLVRPEPEVRIEVLRRCVRYPLTDTEHVLYPQLLKAMNSALPDECQAAAGALFALYQGHDVAPIMEAMHMLLRNRQMLRISMISYLSALSTNRGQLAPTTSAILAVLSEDRLTCSLRVSLIIAGLPWKEVMPALMDLADDLHADALIWAERAIQSIVPESGYSYSTDEFENTLREACQRPDADLYELEKGLIASDDERMRRLALAALVTQVNQAGGWTDERIARLQAFQRDPSPLVAEAAQFTFVS